ncbi:hypothetical protein J5N97_011727 [Dioscorea zingiberensis]|uniref:Autophagy-related protein 2 n=1 Tax=Dioscorea zingiberensis TaxID=325984 RepID=A0A9D5D388_9LILI|nr:hypothetical protein J5N97_011727 [Dioscorea zingiberensis]
MNVSIPWKNGSVDFCKVDADISVNPMEVSIQKDTIMWIIAVWESLRNVNTARESHIPRKAEESSALNSEFRGQFDSLGSSVLLSNKTTPGRGSFSKNSCSTSTQDTDPEALISSLECFDEFRSSQATLGNSGIWNWTCSVFQCDNRCIKSCLWFNTYSYCVPVFSLHSSYVYSQFLAVTNQRHVETNIQASLGEISVILSFLPEEQEHSQRFQHVTLNLQIHHQKMNLEASVMYARVDMFYDKGSISRNLEVFNHKSSSCSHMPLSESLQIQSTRSTYLDGRSVSSVSFIINLPPFVLWVHLPLVNILLNFCKEIQISLERSSRTKDSISDVLDEKNGSSLGEAKTNTSTYITTLSESANTQGNILLPHARIVLCFPTVKHGDSTQSTSLSKFIVFEFSPFPDLGKLPDASAVRKASSSKDKTHGIDINESFENSPNDSSPTQVSILVECDLLDLCINLDSIETSCLVQKELQGSWNNLRLTVGKFELLSVLNIGGIVDANFLWMNHGEGELRGSIVDRDKKPPFNTQDLLLISCSNSTIKRGDGEGANALSFGSAGGTYKSSSCSDTTGGLSRLVSQLQQLYAPDLEDALVHLQSSSEDVRSVGLLDEIHENAFYMNLEDGSALSTIMSSHGLNMHFPGDNCGLNSSNGISCDTFSPNIPMRISISMTEARMPWKMVLGYYHSKNHPRESCAKAFKLDLEVVKPDPLTPLEEYRLHLELLPIRLHLDQSQLNFLIHFFGKDADRISSQPNEPNDVEKSEISGKKKVNYGKKAIVEEALLPFFQKCDVRPVVVRVDYIPRRVDLAALRGGNYAELLNLVPWKGIDLQLKHVCAVGVYGWNSICRNSRWAMVGRYFSQSGARAFIRSISLEAVGLGVHLAAGAHEVLLQTEYILTSIPPSMPSSERDKREMTVRSNQPKDAQQGIRRACESISDGLGRTASALVGTPFKTYQRGGGAGPALVTAIRAAPAAAMAPVSASARAVHCALLGVRNSLDPEHKKESMEKYLGHQQ